MLSSVYGQKLSAFFRQLPIAKTDRHKIVIICPRGLEVSEVGVVGFRSSSSFAQRLIERKLWSHLAYADAYVDDVVIASNSAQDHARHVRNVFQLFKSINLSVNSRDSSFGYPRVQLLGFKVDSLGMATRDKRIKEMADINISSRLHQLKQNVDITGF